MSDSSLDSVSSTDESAAGAVVRVSLIIPAFNEATRIASTLETVLAYFEGQDYRSEVLVVDDGSEDDTVGVVREGFPGVRVVAYERNRGKGHAMRMGMAEAVGAFRVVYDADGSTPIEELGGFWSFFDAGAGIVIGSRALVGSNVQVRQPGYRRLMGRCYNRLLRVLGLTHFRDTQCGFKGFTAACCEVILPRLTVNGFGSDCEMLFVAQLHGIRVEQIPVTWINSVGSRVNPVMDSLKMFLEVVSVRLKAILGRYK